MKVFGFFVFILFRNEGVVAPRFSSCCTQKRITGGRTLVLCAQHLPCRRLGRKSHPHILTHQTATVGNNGSSATTTKRPDKEGPTF